MVKKYSSKNVQNHVSSVFLTRANIVLWSFTQSSTTSSINKIGFILPGYGTSDVWTDSSSPRSLLEVKDRSNGWSSSLDNYIHHGTD